MKMLYKYQSDIPLLLDSLLLSDLHGGTLSFSDLGVMRLHSECCNDLVYLILLKGFETQEFCLHLFESNMDGDQLNEHHA